MVTTMDTNDDANADGNNKENKLCFQLVIKSLSSSLSLESKVDVSNLDNNSCDTDITATTIEPPIYCEAALEAWTSLKGINSNVNDNNPSLNHKSLSVKNWLNPTLKEKEEERIKKVDNNNDDDDGDDDEHNNYENKDNRSTL